MKQDVHQHPGQETTMDEKGQDGVTKPLDVHLSNGTLVLVIKPLLDHCLQTVHDVQSLFARTGSSKD